MQIDFKYIYIYIYIYKYPSLRSLRASKGAGGRGAAVQNYVIIIKNTSKGCCWLFGSSGCSETDSSCPKVIFNKKKRLDKYEFLFFKQMSETRSKRPFLSTYRNFAFASSTSIKNGEALCQRNPWSTRLGLSQHRCLAPTQ